MNPQSPIAPKHTGSPAHPHTHPRPAIARLRPSPARSLLGAGVLGRLGLAAAALVLLWTTILWALR
ncbi:hypothetical protein [Thauera sp.]|jgi:hypothetical protein|uniref:hypothetical protein n=1 Tax=Thauera sp. TaxID=1905334 RepID=UPI002A3611C7|nr:hypothetical protein [Thauera sp.]MDX9885431.1 hypothetical protein [Thauera sp.]